MLVIINLGIWDGVFIFGVNKKARFIRLIRYKSKYNYSRNKGNTALQMLAATLRKRSAIIKLNKMIKRILTFSLILISMICYSQDEVKRTYFKDKYATNESKNDKGKFLMIESQINDSIIKKEFIHSRSKTKIWSKEYLNNKPYGEWIFYEESGEFSYKFDYNFILRYGEIVPDNYLKIDYKKKQLVDKNNADFSMPYLDSPDIGFQMYFFKNVRYPKFARENGIQGTVHIQLTIDKYGKINNISIISGVEELLDRETYRLIHSMPDWTPAKLNGEPINVYLILPITYISQ